MATIKTLMPYLEQGYIAFDPVRHAYLTPKKQDGSLVFEWTAYEGESEWSGPETHTQEYVLTWHSDGWGIVYSSLPNGSGSQLDSDEPEEIGQAIADGLAYKAEDFRDNK